MADTIVRRPAATDPTASRPSLAFREPLAAIAAVAFAIRLVTLKTVADFTPDGGDPFWYHTQANALVRGHGFIDPFIQRATGQLTPGAQHPPLYTLWLSVASAVGFTSYDAHKVMSCLAGVLAVVLIGVAGRAVAGRRAGLIAAGIAAVYPPLWVIDGLLWPEGLFAAMVAMMIWAAHRWAAKPSLASAAVLGVAIALATLTRGEAIGFLVVAVLPLFWFVGRLRGATLVRHLAVAGLAFALLVAPWSVRNAAQFDRFMPLSTNTDEVFVYANNPYAFGLADRTLACRPHPSYPNGLTLDRSRTTYLGFWFFPWEEYLRCRNGEPGGDVSLKSAHWRGVGTRYARDHLGRLPVVAAARLGRSFDLYRPFQGAQLLRFEGRNLTVSKIDVWSWWSVALAAIAGAFVLRRRRITLVPLLSTVTLVVVTSVYAYGSPRFRTPVDVAAVILAAVAVDELARRRRPAGPAPTPAATPGPAVEAR
ncbi:MAG: ArnT family glycosyltransferase [Acidimicrobiales bacterium]